MLATMQGNGYTHKGKCKLSAEYLRVCNTSYKTMYVH